MRYCWRANPLHAQAVDNDSGSTVAMTDSMKQALVSRVESYGEHHTLRCLALASRAMPSSSEPVRSPSPHNWLTPTERPHSDPCVGPLVRLAFWMA